MARLFGTLQPQPYQGKLTGQAIALQAPTRDTSKSTTAFFNWSDYGAIPSRFAAVKKSIVYSATGNYQVTIPLDYSSRGAKLHVIAGGSGARTPVILNGGGSGGGGGAYASIDEPVLFAGAQYWINNPAGSPAADPPVAVGNAWFNTTGVNTAPTGTSQGVLAEGGRGGITGSNGGRASSSIGTTKFDGGAGGVAGRGGCGGGGAGGPNGNGAAGGNTGTSGPVAGAGGGGANGGTAGAAAGTSPASGAGGNNRLGTGGGAAVAVAGTPGNPGTAGGGGSGGAANTSNSGINNGNAGNGGANSIDAMWTDSATGIVYGPASGAGGGGQLSVLITTGKTAGNAGATVTGSLGNGGAGAGPLDAGSGGTVGVSTKGGDGAIILEYYSTVDSAPVIDLRVPVNLKTGVINPIDRVVSVCVDNTDSNATIYVQFGDTQQTILAAPGAIVYAPVFSNLLECEVYCEGLTNFVRQPITRVTFSNRYVAPQTDYEQQTVRPQFLGSVFPGSPVANQQKFRYQAVGDLMWCDWIEIDNLATGSGFTVTFLPTITTNGYYVYVTDISIYVHATLISGAGTTIDGCYLRLSDSTGIINYRLPYVTRNQALDSRVPVLELKNAQLKYPASSLLTFTREVFQDKAGASLAFPDPFTLAYIVMNYSIVDERQAE